MPEIETLLPSFLQKQLWQQDRAGAIGSAHHLRLGWRIIGTLDVDALQLAVATIVKRHAALRSRFDHAGEQLLQIVVDDAVCPFEVIDVRAASVPEEQAGCALIAHRQTPFDLMQGPLVRALSIRIAETVSLFELTVHPIIADSYSVDVVKEELELLYGAFSQQRPSPLPTLTTQYADYVHAQRDWLQGEQMRAALAYWKAALTGAPALLELPLDRRRPPTMRAPDAAVKIAFEPALYRKIAQFCQRQQTTVFVLLAAGLSALLHRYSGQANICLGYPVATRERKELAGLVGRMLNTLVLHAKVEPDQAFEHLLQRVSASVLNAQLHQDLPFEKLLDDLESGRDAGHSPLFQVMLNVKRVDDGTRDLPAAQFIPLVLPATTSSPCDLTVELMETRAGLSGSMAYRTDLFDQSTIETMVGHLLTLTEAALDKPATKIKDLPLLAPDEREKIVVDWNATLAAYPKTETLHQLFEAQAARTPDAIALVFGEHTLSYAALNGKANQLARYLQEQGVRPDNLVGICVERSLEMVIGLLGILKAGGAYVPLDPGYPAQRLRYMLDDAAPVVLLTQSHLLASMPALSGGADGQRKGVPTFCIDSQWPAVAGYPSHAVACDCVPANLAYVIYTSGSTGRPKGVAVEHASVVNFMCSMRVRPGMDHTDVMLCLTSLSFDIAGLELFLPLTVGATAILSTRDDAGNPARLWELIQKHRISMVQATPSTWRMLLNHGWPALSHPLKLLSGGEALPAELAQGLLAHTPAVWNMYGPTETTIWSTVRQITAADTQPSIGRPIANTQVYILDPALQPVPVGVAGELHIAGDGLARGYLNRPDLSAEKFIRNPFSQSPGARMYKSGDLARYLSDGNIDYLGRIDDQVKVRGFRIELAEIEAALAALAQVREAVVLARTDSEGDKALVAYLVAREGCSLDDTAALRAALLQTLPEYMVPACFMVIAQLPLTPNGKTDRKALPAPDMQRTDDGYVAPTNEVEKQLTQVWAEVLKLDRVGIHDNFFALGGHSLLVVRMTLRLKAKLKWEVLLPDVFKAPTVAQLAALLCARPASGVAPPLRIAAIGPRSGRPSFAQEDLLPRLHNDIGEFGDKLFTIRSAWRVDGAMQADRLQQAFDHVIARHDALRTAFVKGPAGFVATVDDEARTPLRVDDLESIAHDPEAVRRRVIAALSTPLDIARAPLLRLTLHRLSDDRHIVGMAVSHLIFDGESAHIFWDEVIQVYGALVAQLTPSLGPLPLQYSAFTDWQRHFVAHDPLATSQRNYWRQRLAGMPEQVRLPYDFPRPPMFSHEVAVVTRKLEPGLVSDIREQGKQQGWTLYVQSLAALFAMLAAETGQGDLFLYASSDGRSAPELFGSIGFYSRAAIIRGQVDAADTCAGFVSQIQARVLEALSNQHIPRSEIGAMLPVAKPDATQGPSGPIGFSYVRVGAPRATPGGLEMQRYPYAVSCAQNDLRMTLVDSPTGIELELKYYRPVFRADTAQRMLSGMVAALAFCSEHALDRPVAALLAHMRQDAAEPAVEQ
jgi:amino acid adenylation domain-containing protein